MGPRHELAQPSALSIFQRFRSFWHEVDAARADVLAASQRRATSGSSLVGPNATVRARLLGILKAQEAEMSRMAPDEAAASYRDAHYLMTAVADEVFLNLPWDGASSWLWRPLEVELYGTRSAGQQVFDRIDRLTADPLIADRELAAVYLVALALGFEGKFAGSHDRSALDEYRRKLRDLISMDREPLDQRLIPDCYAYTLDVGRGPLLQNVRAWWWAVAAVVAAWLFGSTIVWRQVTAPVAEAVARVDAAPAQGTR